MDSVSWLEHLLKSYLTSSREDRFPKVATRIMMIMMIVVVELLLVGVVKSAYLMLHHVNLDGNSC